MRRDIRPRRRVVVNVLSRGGGLSATAANSLSRASTLHAIPNCPLNAGAGFNTGVGNFADGTPREVFITYSGSFNIYVGTTSVGSGGYSYSVSGSQAYIGDPPWSNSGGEWGRPSLGGTVEAIAIYGRVLNTTEMTDLTASICGPVTPEIAFDSAASGDLETVTPAVLTVLLENPEEGQTYTVDYTVTGGTAIGGGVDYTLIPATLTFNPGETSKTISIDIVNDGSDEEDETIIVELSNPTGPEVSLGEITQHTYTILDARPAVYFEPDSGSGTEDGSTVMVI